MSLGLIGMVGVLVLMVVSLGFFISTRYKRCPSNRILVVYGKVGKGETSRCLHGGGTFVWPLIQDYTYLSMEPLGIKQRIEGLSNENIKVNIPANFTVGISSRPEILNNAAERLLGLGSDQIRSLAGEAILGQLRQVVASMKIEELNRDRDNFAKLIKQYVETELNKIGLTVLTVNIEEITDNADYLASIGKRAAEEARQKAEVDVAEQLRLGASGKAKADKEREISVSESMAEQEIRKNAARFRQLAEVETSRAESLKIQNESKANAAEYEADLKVREAESLEKGEIAKLDAERKVMDMQKKLRMAEIEKEELARQEVELKKAKLAAEAKAEAIRIEAKAEAEKITLESEAKAKGEKALLDAKAEGYKSLMESMGDQAVSILTVEQLPQLVAAQVEAIKGIKIDKLTILEGGSGNAISSLAKDLTRALPGIHEIAKNVGLELPETLGKMAQPESTETGEDTTSSKDSVTDLTTKSIKKPNGRYHNPIF